MRHPESKIQISFIKWIELQHPKLSQFIIHIPNGGKMNIITGKILKNMGVKAGVADILFMWKKEHFGGLWLEFKSSLGKQSEAQKKFEELTFIAQYDYCVVKSLKEAIIAFDRYMSMP